MEKKRSLNESPVGQSHNDCSVVDQRVAQTRRSTLPGRDWEKFSEGTSPCVSVGDPSRSSVARCRHVAVEMLFPMQVIGQGCKGIVALGLLDLT